MTSFEMAAGMAGFIRIESVIKMDGMVLRRRDRGWAMGQGLHWIKESLMGRGCFFEETNAGIDKQHENWGSLGFLGIDDASRQGR